uniref:uncharacterized protein LOC117255394 n=1 Tax=Epinephelus lanceolatus TaxID=310571 RepID=UPI00144510E3|nr:uncharacterized protein LOC117255394 [Epinephelus lanceolatus]
MCLETLFDETRAESPQSVLSDFDLDKLFKNRALSPESVSSDFDFSLLQDWLAEFRASSPESVTSVEQRSLSPRMRFDQMQTQHCNFYLQYSESRPLSPFSTLSDVEYSGFCLEELFDDNRPDSPDLLTSPVDTQQSCFNAPACHHPFATKLLTYGDVLRGIGPEKEENVVLVQNQSTPKFSFSEIKPLSAEDSVSVDDPQNLIQLKCVSAIPTSSDFKNEYRARHKHVFSNFMSHLYDPVYKGKCSCCKISSIEATVENQSCMLSCIPQKHDILAPSSVEKHSSVFSFSFHRASDVKPADEFLSPSAVITGPVSPACQSNSGISQSGTIETGSTGHCQHAMETEVNDSSSLSEYGLSSPEILHPDDESHFYFTCLFTDQRPPSPDSFDEFTALTPDSQIPQFDCQPCYDMHLAEIRSVSPDSIMLERDSSDLCLDTMVDDIRTESPNSIVFDNELNECLSNMPSDQYSQSFLDFWLSELRPSTPEILKSLDIDEVLNQQPCGPSLPDETVDADSRPVYKQVSDDLMAHVQDPVYKEKHVCDKVHFFEDPVDKLCEKTCDQKKIEDLTVSTGEPHGPAKSCHSARTIPDSKSLQDSSVSDSTVPVLTVTDSHPQMVMPPAGTVETRPIASSSNTIDQSFFVKPPPWAAKNLD